MSGTTIILILLVGAGGLWWLRSAMANAAQTARLIGMKEAADSLVMGIAHHYETDGHPPAVVRVLSEMQTAVEAKSDPKAQADLYRQHAYKLGDAMGQECVDVGKRGRKLEYR
ncbi:hypothetical protein HNQ36_003316 [Afipia massiliensis]|uniref:Uncharacterized protein n=1 Tax=Afipia massiliensis TaxID=211460 RepID=A0A840MZH7_9BRAD|nr:hypothetical protein [Afipia massiliensis]MBB5053325.1 hypothetical protein [Afipia massiliensis]